MREIYHMNLTRKLLLLVTMILLLIIMLMIMKQYTEQDQDLNNSQTEQTGENAPPADADSTADGAQVQSNETDLPETTVSLETTTMSETEAVIRTAPVLSGVVDRLIEIGHDFDPLDGVSARDTFDGDLRKQITWTGKVDPFRTGEYKLDYYVENSAGQPVAKSRTVYVDDPYASLRSANEVQASEDFTTYRLLSLTLDTLDNLTNQMGVFYYDLNSGNYFTINAQKQFRSASTAKVFTVMALYDQADAGIIDLTSEITYIANDYEDGSGVLKDMDLSVGYSLQTLADYALIHSDNIAFHMIMRSVGRDNVYDYYEKIIGHPTNRTSTEMSAADAGSLLLHLYKAENEYFPQMLEVMRHSVYKDALPRDLPDEIVSNKIGFYLNYYHDIGIVHDQDNPYILAVFSENIYAGFEQNPEDVLARLSRIIYENRR